MDLQTIDDQPDIISPFNRLEKAELDLNSLRSLPDGKVAVLISSNFVNTARLVVDDIMKQAIKIDPAPDYNDRLLSHFRKMYLDISEQLVDRINTDLNADEICVLHFGLIKSLMSEIADSLQKHADKLKRNTQDLKISGENHYLYALDHVQWLGRNYALVVYRVLKLILSEFSRAGNRAYQNKWKQVNDVSINSQEILFSPILQCPDFRSPQFMLENFYLWETKNEHNLSKISIALEDIFTRYLPELSSSTFKPPVKVSTVGMPRKNDDGQLELNFSYSGKHALEGNVLSETFTWLDNVNIVTELFDLDAQKQKLTPMFMGRQFGRAWQIRSQYKRIRKSLDKISDFLQDEKLLVASVASRRLNEIWPTQINYHIDFMLIYQYLCGEISLSQLTSSVPRQHKLNALETGLLKETRKNIVLATRDDENKCSFELLQLLAEYRRNLKYFRMASDIFSRIKLVNEKEAAEMQERDEHLYSLLSTHETSDTKTSQIGSHTVLHMCIRGITSLRNILQKSGTDGEKYIQEQLLDPVKQMIQEEGANIVALKNTKLVVNYYELRDDATRVNSVAEATSLARKLIKLVSQINTSNSSNGYPNIGVSIGISFEDNSKENNDTNAPTSGSGIKHINAFVAAEMLTLSTESNVPPEILDYFNTHITYGQDRNQNLSGNLDMISTQALTSKVYNYNGVLLTRDAFLRLKQEHSMHRVNIKLGEHDFLFHIAFTPQGEDNTGIWIREGYSSVIDQSFQNRSMKGASYFELVLNPDTIRQARNYIRNNT